MFRDLLEVIEWSMEQAFEQLLDRACRRTIRSCVNDFITASENAAPFMQKLFRSQKREQVERLRHAASGAICRNLSAKGKLPRSV